MKDWIDIKERLPNFNETKNGYTFVSDEVIIQTKKGNMFFAICKKSISCIDGKIEYNWYSHGTGGRKMKVIGKVVAWMPAPEKYKETK